MSPTAPAPAVDEGPSAARILATSLGAAVVAAVALFAVVLPAEFGFDPLGTGRALGVVGLSRDATSTLARQDGRFLTDEARFILSPFESMEYKYRLEEGDSMLYDWTATGELLYELHSEPGGAEPGYAESFDRARADHGAGTYVAPFPGVHGWFWENRGDADATLTLRTAGFYSTAFEYRDGGRFERPVGGQAGAGARSGVPSGARSGAH